MANAVSVLEINQHNPHIILKLSSHRLRLSSGLTGSGRQKLEFGVALGPWHVLGMADCKTLPPFHTLQL